MKIQYIAAFPWTSYERRRALNICSKTNGLFGQQFKWTVVSNRNYFKKERNMFRITVKTLI